jgi:hypothetical protein
VLSRREAIALQAATSNERFAGRASGENSDQPYGLRAAEFAHRIFGEVRFPEEIQAIFLCFGIEGNVTNKGSDNNNIRFNLNSCMKLAENEGSATHGEYWVKDFLWNAKFSVKFSQGEKGSPDGKMYLWVVGNEFGVAVGTRLLRCVMHLYRDDAVPNLRGARLGSGCYCTSVDEAYHNHQIEQALALDALEAARAASH